jgi:hypothetical protein
MTTLLDPPPSVPTGRILVQAERATRALLDAALDATGLEFAPWAALNFVATSTEPVTRDQATAQLATALHRDSDPSEVLDTAISLGLVSESDGLLAATSDGIARLEVLSAAVAPVTARVYAGIDPADVEVTRRVLATVAARARAQLA